MKVFIFGNNTTRLIRNNHKRSYSLPQQVLCAPTPFLQCATGLDFVLFLTSTHLYCYFQSAFHLLSQVQQLLQVIAFENTILVLTVKGDVLTAEFNRALFLTNDLKFTPLSFPEPIVGIHANFGDIFAEGANRTYHVHKNSWHDEDKFSLPAPLETKTRFKQIAPATTFNWFLSQDGRLFVSSKQDPCQLKHFPTQHRFIKIAVAQYQVGITTNGQLYIWGNSVHGHFSQPTPFGEIYTSFKDVSLGFDSGFAISEDKQAWVWGRNGFGQLGTSDYEARLSPFPLLSLEEYQIEGFFPGDGFTICQACSRKSNESKKEKTRVQKVLARKVDRGDVKKGIQSGKQTEKERGSRSVSRTVDSKSRSAKSCSFKHGEQTKKQIHESSLETELAKEELMQRVKLLEEENSNLKFIVKTKDETIYDITNKIHLLEEAIEEYERSISRRDSQEPYELADSLSARSTFRMPSEFVDEQVLRPRDTNLIDKVIHRIQESKSSISKSAQKLKQMLVNE